MKKDPTIYLEDILNAIQQIRKYTEGMNHSKFASEEMAQDAVARQFIIIGEAANRFGKLNQQNISTIPWDNIIGMRNILTHDYGNTSVNEMWNSIENDFDPLQEAITHYLKDHPPKIKL